jgi:ubiquinone/menaquinone biosynthesis C-methylase UbiE
MEMARRQPNKQLNLTVPGSLPVRIATYQRRRMFERFLSETKPDTVDKILDVGVAADVTYETSNYLEQWYTHKSAITAVGLDNAAYLEQLYGVRFVRANGLRLPFQNAAFDVVHSSAVLEHVGSLQNQISFVQECCRVARRSVFLTTPNRWFPVEFHIVLPVVHWLPKKVFRALMRAIGYGFFADENNLNLLSVKEVRAISAQVSGFVFGVSSMSLLGWPSNILLTGRRIDS